MKKNARAAAVTQHLQSEVNSLEAWLGCGKTTVAVWQRWARFQTNQTCQRFRLVQVLVVLISICLYVPLSKYSMCHPV